MKIHCHCQNIKIEAPEPERLTICNCSICSRYQALWGYYTPNSVTINVGQHGEKAYCWGDQCIEFVSCGYCGCITHYRTLDKDPRPRIAVNFRMVDEETVADIPIRHFDGKNLLK